MSSKKRRHFTADKKAQIVRRHLAEKVVSFIELPQADVIEDILHHCGLWQSSTPRAPDGRGKVAAVSHSDSNRFAIERTAKPDPRPTVLRFRPAFHHLQSRFDEEPEGCQAVHSTRASGEPESPHRDEGPKGPGIQPAPRNKPGPDAAG